MLSDSKKMFDFLFGDFLKKYPKIFLGNLKIYLENPLKFEIQNIFGKFENLFGKFFEIWKFDLEIYSSLRSQCKYQKD